MSFTGRPKVPELLRAEHLVAGFDCDIEPLNTYLRKFAATNNASGFARTFVSCDDRGAVMGYYTLAAGQVLNELAAERLKKGGANHPVAVTVLARLAVDAQCKLAGIGRSLLLDAITRVVAASENIGIRAILVHAKDDKAADFYRHNAAFETLPGDRLALFLLLKDAKKTLGP
jgi:GNAT superfamily N-acetyltransferase